MRILVLCFSPALYLVVENYEWVLVSRTNERLVS